MRYRLGPSLLEQNGGLTVRIGVDARKCVVFFGVLEPAADPAGQPTIQYGGTGFLVSREDDGIWSRYIVTCRHVANRLAPPCYMRLNLVKGGAEPLELPHAEWIPHPDPTVDVSVVMFEGLNGAKYDHLTMPLSHALTPDDDIECGDPVSIVGLFRLHRGKKRNVPIVHSGHIAALADASEKVPLRGPSGIVECEVHLVEAQTLEGLSGSPVFVHRMIGLDKEGQIGGIRSAKLFGVYQGAWDGEPGSILAADRSLSGKSVRVPVGMGAVIPISRVIELIEGDKTLKERRAQAKQKELESRAANMDSAFSDTPQSNDANPMHREDFNSMLIDAAKIKTEK